MRIANVFALTAYVAVAVYEAHFQSLVSAVPTIALLAAFVGMMHDEEAIDRSLEERTRLLHEIHSMVSSLVKPEERTKMVRETLQRSASVL